MRRSRGFISAYFPPRSPPANISLFCNAKQYRACDSKHIAHRRCISRERKKITASASNKIYLLDLHPPFLEQKYAFCRLDTRGKFSLSAKADKLKRYKSLTGFAIYATFHSRAICLRRDMCLRHVSALRVQGRGDLCSRTFHHVRYRRTYRCFALRCNIAFAEQIYRAPKVHIA